MSSIADTLNKIEAMLRRSEDKVKPEIFEYIIHIMRRIVHGQDMETRLALWMTNMIDTPQCTFTSEFFEWGSQIVTHITSPTQLSYPRHLVISMQRFRSGSSTQKPNDITLTYQSFSELLHMWNSWSMSLSSTLGSSDSFRMMYQHTYVPLFSTVLRHFVRCFDSASLRSIAKSTSTLSMQVVSMMSEHDKSLVVWHLIQILSCVLKQPSYTFEATKSSKSLTNSSNLDGEAEGLNFTLMNRVGKLVFEHARNLASVMVDVVNEHLLSDSSAAQASASKIRVTLANHAVHFVRLFARSGLVVNPSALQLAPPSISDASLVCVDAVAVHHRVSALLELLSASQRESSELIQWVINQVHCRLTNASSSSSSSSKMAASDSDQGRKDKRKATADDQTDDAFFEDAPFQEQPKQARTAIRSAKKSGYSLTDSLNVKPPSSSAHRQSTSHAPQSAITTPLIADSLQDIAAAVATQCSTSSSLLEQSHLCARTLVRAAADVDGLHRLLAQTQNALSFHLQVIVAYESVLVALTNDGDSSDLSPDQIAEFIRYLSCPYSIVIRKLTTLSSSDSVIALQSVSRVYAIQQSLLHIKKSDSSSSPALVMQLSRSVHDSLKGLVADIVRLNMTGSPTDTASNVHTDDAPRMLNESLLFCSLDVFLIQGDIKEVKGFLGGIFCCNELFFGENPDTVETFVNSQPEVIRKSITEQVVAHSLTISENVSASLTLLQMMSVSQIYCKLSAPSNIGVGDHVRLQNFGNLSAAILSKLHVLIDVEATKSNDACQIVHDIQRRLKLHAAAEDAARSTGAQYNSKLSLIVTIQVHDSLRNAICDIWNASCSHVNAFFSGLIALNSKDTIESESTKSLHSLCELLVSLRALVTVCAALEKCLHSTPTSNQQNNSSDEFLAVGKKIDETFLQLSNNAAVLWYVRTRRDVSYAMSSIYTMSLQHQYSTVDSATYTGQTMFTDNIVSTYSTPLFGDANIADKNEFDEQDFEENVSEKAAWIKEKKILALKTSRQIIVIQSLSRSIIHVTALDKRFGFELIHGLGLCWLRAADDDFTQNFMIETFSWLRADGVLDDVLGHDLKACCYSLVSPLIRACRGIGSEANQSTVFAALHQLLKAIGIPSIWSTLNSVDNVILKFRVFVDVCSTVKDSLQNSSVIAEAMELLIKLAIVDDTYRKDTFAILYHLLIDGVESGKSEESLLTGEFMKMMTAFCASWKSLANVDLSFDSGKTEMDLKCLRPLVWDLGGTSTQADTALKALRVLCTLEQSKSWTVSLNRKSTKGSPPSQESIPQVSSNLQENVSIAFNQNFFRIMANVIDYDWAKWTEDQRSQSVRALTRVVTMILETDMKKFLPKVFTFIEKAIDSSSEKVIEETVELINTLCRSFAQEVLGDGLVHLAVTLFTLIESPIVSATTPVSSSMDSNIDLDTIRHRYLRKAWESRVVSRIIAVLEHIFAIKVGNHKFLLSIGKIPNRVASATDIEKKQLEVLNSQSLDVTLRLYANYLNHESSAVKANILRKLSDLCRKNRSAVHTLLQPLVAASAVTISKDQLGDKHPVLNLLGVLLSLPSRDSNQRVLVECARCIGELGAVDSSLVSSQFSSQERSSTSLPPWKCESTSPGILQFGIHLLVHYLVPSFKALSSDQNRVEFAIQSILTQLKSELQESGSKSSSKSSSKSNSGAEKIRDVPAALDAALTKYKIGHDTEPFFYTNYTIQDTVLPWTTPFYVISNIHFSRWIGLWTRHLGTVSHGPLRAYFGACRGAARTRSDLCQFFLPYLIADIVSAPEDAANTKSHQTEFDKLLLEICLVLVDGDINTLEEHSIKTTIDIVNEEGKSVSVLLTREVSRFQGNDMAVQAVFEVIQTLATWKADLERIRTDEKSKSGVASSSKNAPHFTPDMHRMLVGIKRLLDAIPQPLLGQAAYRTKAYASALKFFEMHVRKQALSNRAIKHASTPVSSIYGDRNDGSNSSLPVLSLSELDQFMAIYSELDDSDALQGFLTLRQIRGFPATYWTRIKEFEQTENWMAALHEYGAAHSHVFDASVANKSNMVKSEGIAVAIESSSSNPASTMQKGLPTTSHKARTPFVETSKSGSNADETTGSSKAAFKRRLSFGIPTSTNKSSSLADQAKLFSTPCASRVQSVPQSGSSMKENAKNRSRPSLAPSTNKHETSKQHDSDRMREDDQAEDDLIEADNTGDGNDPISEEAISLTKGTLRCLIELGHLDNVIEQALHDQDPIEPDILALGIEASWQLSDWGSLQALSTRSEAVLPSWSDTRLEQASQSANGTIVHESSALDSRTFAERALKMPPETAFQIRLGRIVSSLHTRDQRKFNRELELCRRDIMQTLSAAFKESYERTYPYITRLQILSELEDGGNLLGQASTESRSNQLRTFEWEKRLELMSTSYQSLSLTLATRRSILSMSGMKTEVTNNWLDLCRRMRKMGRFDSARLALRMAESMDLGPYKQDIVLLEECQLLRSEGEMNKALALLEPVELNPYELSMNWTHIANLKRAKDLQASARPLLEIMTNETRKKLFAKRLLMATQLMVENRQKYGKVIVERYNLYLQMCENDDLVRFELGRYHESLYSELRDKKTSGQAALSAHDEAEQDEASIRYVIGALKSYLRALHSGQVPIMTQALPRMLTLWFSATWNPEVKSKVPAAIRLQQEVTKLMEKETPKISSYIWFHCMTQLVSRADHNHDKTVSLIYKILFRVLVAYPSNAIWHIAVLLRSSMKERSHIGAVLIQNASANLKEAGKTAVAQMLMSSVKLFEQMEILARFRPADKNEQNMESTIGRGLDLTKFLVPTQQTLMHVSPQAHSANPTSLAYHASEDDYIVRFRSQVKIQLSKARPKTVVIDTSTGCSLKFLIKREKEGDLRKDARMMEFNAVVNRLLKEDPTGHKNNLRLRTYAVVCLNEECGIIEWVNDTTALRATILRAYQLGHGQYPFHQVNTDAVAALQERVPADFDALTSEFKRLVWDKIRPCFHLWFLEQFPDPTQWLEARTRFTRSAAVWSCVGHVIGLGDRHTLNILLDVTNGECVQVDFDCIFDHGLTLPVPELVPFRLSPNMVDAMGVTGIEGTFRNTMEVTMGLLRSNKDVLLSVLEPFLRDPTVHWDRGGKAQQGDGSVANVRVVPASAENMNALAKEALLKISGRLSGIYNIAHPKANEIIDDCLRNGRMIPNRGLGAAKDEALPMGVSGQVKRIIEEAILPENLAQMFVGYEAWM